MSLAYSWDYHAEIPSGCKLDDIPQLFDVNFLNHCLKSLGGCGYTTQHRCLGKCSVKPWCIRRKRLSCNWDLNGGETMKTEDLTIG